MAKPKQWMILLSSMNGRNVGLFSDFSVGDLARVTVGKSISYMFLAFS